jgi:flavodoxin
MNYALRYYSKGGNTKKLAEALSGVLGVDALPIDAARAAISEETDILFLGSAPYAFDIDPVFKAYLERLDASLVKKAAVFSTSALTKSIYPYVKKVLDAKGIALDPRYYNCHGAFKFMHKGRPNATDVEAAQAWAKGILG